MKKHISLTAILMLVTFLVQAQAPNYKVVFDMTSRDSVNQQSLIRELGLIRESNPTAKLEVVLYGQGLDLVIKGRSSQEPNVARLLTDKDISFKVCAIAMKRTNIVKDQLIPGVDIVPDGIYEIISKQQEGWGYIKVAH
ncbi:MAG: DsrE family protein [Bacteroidota bacterium]|nr:DsrE family protein [Bacteroidota bacterium]